VAVAVGDFRLGEFNKMRIGRTRSVSGITTFSTVCMKRTLPALTMLAGLVLLGTGAAQADQIRFFTGANDGYSGIFSGLAVYQAVKNDAVACPSGSCVPNNNGDIVTLSPISDQVFQGGLVTATSSAGGGVWNDLNPGFAGLGVGIGTQLNGSGSDLDQIAAGDILHIHFQNYVQLTGVGTLFVDPHKPFGTGFPEETDVSGTNTIRINGIDVSLLHANSATIALDGIFAGHDFFFTVSPGTNPDYYVGALTWITAQVCAPGAACEGPTTPIPGALPLFATGLGVLGLLGRRRMRKNAAAVTTA